MTHVTSINQPPESQLWSPFAIKMNVSADFSNFYLVFGVSVKFQVQLTTLLFQLFCQL